MHQRRVKGVTPWNSGGGTGQGGPEPAQDEVRDEVVEEEVRMRYQVPAW